MCPPPFTFTRTPGDHMCAAWSSESSSMCSKRSFFLVLFNRTSCCWKKKKKTLAMSFQPEKLNSITRCGTWAWSVWSDGSSNNVWNTSEHDRKRAHSCRASPASYCVFNARPRAAAPRRPCMWTRSFTPSPSLTLCEAAHPKSNQNKNDSHHCCCCNRQYF